MGVFSVGMLLITLTNLFNTQNKKLHMPLASINYWIEK